MKSITKPDKMKCYIVIDGQRFEECEFWSFTQDLIHNFPDSKNAKDEHILLGLALIHAIAGDEKMAFGDFDLHDSANEYDTRLWKILQPALAYLKKKLKEPEFKLECTQPKESMIDIEPEYVECQRKIKKAKRK